MEVNGIKFWCYTAGHVLGAAMFMIEIAGVKVSFVYKSLFSGLLQNVLTLQYEIFPQILEK